MQSRRDSFEDDRSQSAVERLTEMADRLDERADESLAIERKANTERRARFAASAESAANADKALAKTMRNIAQAILNGKAKFLDRVRQKAQVEMLSGIVRTANDNELRAKYPAYADQEKRKGEPVTGETADYAEFPQYTAYRSDLASLGRQLLDTDGTKKLGQAILKVADDVTDAYLKFARENLHKVSTFSLKDGEKAIIPSKDVAEAAIARSGFKGKAIVLPFKRGQNIIIMSPSAAREAGIWQGDDDKRITLKADFGAELVEKVGKANKKISMPWQFVSTYERRKALAKMGIETPYEFRAMVREFISLREQAKEADRVKMLERAMVGRQKDGLDFFPTPKDVADQMVDAAEITPDMSVLEPSAGMGHIADRIREAGAEPDVIELSGDRRELLQEKGFHVMPENDFMSMEPRKFYTYGDVFRAQDGTEGIMRGSGGMGSERVRLEDEQGNKLGLYNREDLTGIRHSGTDSGYDRIIMNPPFSDRRDAEHVRHAYMLLKPGGRLVAIMGEGVFFGQDKKAQAFREWLDEVGGTSEKLEEGSFMDPSLPVNTGVNARMVVVNKPTGATSFSIRIDGNDAVSAVPMDDVAAQKIINGFRASFPGANKMVAVPDFAALPVNVQKDARDQGGNEKNTKGAFDHLTGTVYIVAGNHSSEADVSITNRLSRLNQSRPDTGRRIHQEDLDAVAQSFRAAFPGLVVHPLETERQAPKELLRWIKEQGASGEWSAAIHKGEVYLLRTGLQDAEHAMETAIHEAEHIGLERMFGQRVDPVMLSIYQSNPMVKAQADKLMTKYRYSAVRATNEVLADMGPKAKQLVGWKRLVAAIREILRSIKFRGRQLVSNWSDNDVEALVLRALSAAKRPVGNHVALGNWMSRDGAENFLKSIREVLDDSMAGRRLPAAPIRVMDHAPTTLRVFGWDDMPVSMKPSEVDKVHFDHGITAANIAKLIPETLESPAAILLSETNPGRLVFVANKAGEKPVLLVVSPDTSVDRKPNHLVVSMYPKDEGWEWVARQIRRGMLAYRDTSVEKLRGAVADAQKKFAQKGRFEGADRDRLKGLIPKSGHGFLSEGYKVLLPSDLCKFEEDDFGIKPGSVNRLSRIDQAGAGLTPEERADVIINKKVTTLRPVEAVMKVAVKLAQIDKLTTGAYHQVGKLLDAVVPESVKAGMVSDYGIPEAVIDRRAVMQGSQRELLRQTGNLLDRLATLTRAESRVAYEWMNADNPQASDWYMAQLPAESVKTMAEVEKLIDTLSKEAVKLGQLDPEVFKKNRFAYLRRSYVKHTAELTQGESQARSRAISILGDQYKGRGMVDTSPMARIKNIAPEWWNRKTQQGKADKQLRGEKFIRLERRQQFGTGVADLAGFAPGGRSGKLLEVAYWPADQALPAKYSTWEQAGTWEVRDTKGEKLVLWRDFTKAERVAMGEIDEVRYAIAKTLHGMIHDVETGKYLEWLAQRYGKKEGEEFDGKVVDASDRMRDTFAPGTWVQVPDTKVPGTKVAKYGKLAGRYLPGPIWNDVRQTVGFRFRPFGETYAQILGAWKTSKTALSPAVHLNNVMANFVMADWHDVTAAHTLKALRIMLAAQTGEGRGAIGRIGNGAGYVIGLDDREAAKVVLQRYEDSGGSLGTWAAKELQQEQLAPLLNALEKEVGIAGDVTGQVGVYAALQKALQLKFPDAFEALMRSKPGKVVGQEAKNMLALYESEDQVFRLAAWLKAKEDGESDMAAGKQARKSFLDYSINAPWVQAMRSTAFPFIAFTYRAVPMALEVAAKKPWKLAKLALLAGALNAIGYALSGGDEDDERGLLPEEKAGRIWGMVPKLIRMPWNDGHGSPVFLDIRRFIPVGDVFDTGQEHAVVPILPAMSPGGPLALLGELLLNKSQFTGKAITLETDTATEKAGKVLDYLYKAMAPNLIMLPGTYAWQATSDSLKGKTDSFGREQSPMQAVISSFGVKVGSYPKDVLRLNATRAAQAKMMEIDRNITSLKREYQRHGMTTEEFQSKVAWQMEKKRELVAELTKKMGGL